MIARESKAHVHRLIPLDSSADRQKIGSQASNVSVVLTSAVSDLSDNDKTSSATLLDEQNNYCGNEYLEPDYREWLSNFRRRSSNLSDIASRRSSCSTKYSSDFSSEFEDYYDSFQKREQKLKPKAIVEETAKSAVNSFATSLISNLLHDGALTAALDQTTVQKFRTGEPASTIQKPIPVKGSTKSSKHASFGSALLVSSKSVQKAALSEDIVRKYVDKLFETIPCGDEPLPNGRHNEKERILVRNKMSSNGDKSKNDGVKSSHSRDVVSPGLNEFCEDLAGTILQEALSTFEFCTTKAHEYIKSSTNLTSCCSFDDISVTDLVQTVVIADRLVNQIFDEVRIEFFPSQLKKSSLRNKNNSANSCNSTNGDGDAGRDPQSELQLDGGSPLPPTATPRTGLLRYAESLSRTILTKAFMEVQLMQRRRPICRRSSSSSISSHTHTSRSDAYLAHFANELARRSSLDDMNLLRRRSSSGFRDITLSRFAEELIRSMPHPLYVDMFSNSRRNSADSVCSQRSSTSGFRDSVLANFEDELLHSNISQSGTKSRTKRHRKHHGNKPRWSMSKHNASGSPCNVCTCIVDLYENVEDAIIDFSDEVACDVLNMSFSSIFIDSCNNEVKFTPVRQDVRRQLERYAGFLAETILHDSLLLAHIVSSSEGTSSYSSDSSSVRALLGYDQKRVTFHDALDMPYGKLKFWSDVKARQILITAYNELHSGDERTEKSSQVRILPKFH